MVITFLKHQIIAFNRSRNRAGNIAAKAFMGFMFFYILVFAIWIGLILDKLIPEIFPDKRYS